MSKAEMKNSTPEIQIAASPAVPKIAKPKADVANRPEPVAIYSYVDECGVLLFEKVRYKNQDGTKEFSHRRRSGPRRWEYSLGDCRRVLYNLPAILSAAEDGKFLFLCEGEKDADRLTALGLKASTNTEGACTTESRWRPEYTESLKKCSVVILQDNDTVGFKHAQTVAKLLTERRIPVKVVLLPGLQVKGDVSDWLDAGHDVDELKQIVVDTPQWQPLTIGQEVEKHKTASKPKGVDDGHEDRIALAGLEAFYATDAGNGVRFREQYGDSVKYAKGVGWFIWDGKRWARDVADYVHELAKTVANTVKEEAYTYSGKLHTELMKWAVRSAQVHGYMNTLSAARSIPGMSVDLADFDSDPLLLNCQNGVLDLRTGELLPHSRQLMCSRILNINYSPDAEAPRWEAFLRESMNGDQEMIDFLHRAAGYSITGLTSAQVFFLCFGPGGSGKSKFLNAMRELLGDYSVSASSKTFMQSNGSSGSSDLARLAGARYIGVGEVPNGRWNEALIKEFSGEDVITASMKFQPEIEFVPIGKLWFRSNVRPRVDVADTGFWRRVLIISFIREVPDADKDEHLDEKLREELEGILTWAVEGCAIWQKEGLRPPDSVDAAIQEYQENMDIFGQFIQGCCWNSDAAICTKKQLYTVYEKWCKDYGHLPMNGRDFGTRMKELKGVSWKRWGDGYRYRGIGLKAEFKAAAGDHPEDREQSEDSKDTKGDD